MADGNVKGFRRRNGTQETGDGGADGVLGALIVAGEDDGPILTADSAEEKTPVVATVTASGDTTIHTPASGKRIKLYWITAINDPDEDTNPLIKVKLGGTEYYRVYATAHREVFTGSVNGSLVINLSEAASVAVTAHIQEVD